MKNNMRKYNHQLIDWDAFSKYSKDFFDDFCPKVEAFLARQKIFLSRAEIHATFGLPISENAFTNFLKNNNFTFGEYSVNKESQHERLVYKYELDPLNEDVYLHLGFFHRHDQFNQEFHAHGARKSDLEIRNMQPVKIEIPNSILRIFGLQEYEPAIISRLAFLLVNRHLLEGVCPDVLGSAHGIYNDLGALHLAKAIRNEKKIILVQPGFIHLQAKFIHQVEYELNVASHYIGWGEGREEPNVYHLGSMYSSKSSDFASRKDSALILLPQIPRTNPRPFSFYWSHVNDFYPLIENLIPKLHEIRDKHQSVKARCKHLDLNQYKQLFQAKNIDLPLIGANVNDTAEHLKPTKHTYVSYFSTSIVEAVYAGSNVQTTFDSSSYLLNSKYAEDAQLFDAKQTDQSLLNKYVNTYAKKANPESFIKELIQTIK